MTSEDKNLLLKDLCARLPYGVIVDYKENEFETPHWKITVIYPEAMDGWIGYDKKIGTGSESGSRPFNIGEFKPYLRPISSMTEEEKKEVKENRCIIYWDTSLEDKGLLVFTSPKGFDWLNKKMFDYRRLIERGLALEAPEDMYN